MEPCYICLDEISNGQPCYGHVANDRYYRPVNVAAAAAAVGRDAVIHAIHLECLKGLMATENAIHPNRCGCCRAVLDIPVGSPLGDVYRSPAIQGNEGLRQRWARNFPGVAPGQQPARRVDESEGMRGMREFIRAHRRANAPVGARENACRKFSSFIGKTVNVIVTATLIVCVVLPCFVPRIAFQTTLCLGVIHVAKKIMRFVSTEIARFVSTNNFQIPKESALLCVGVVMLLSVPASRRILKSVLLGACLRIDQIVNRYLEIERRMLNEGVDASERRGEACGFFVERHLFAITNGVTRRLANMRLFRRAA